MRRSVLPAALVLASLPAAAGHAGEPVRVTNFPRVQEVEVRSFPAVQAVELRSPVPVTRSLAWRDVVVAPDPPSVDDDDLERLHELGLLEAGGFRTLAVSVAGRSGGSPLGGGLELVLLPDEPLVVDAWKKDGVVLLEERLPVPLLQRPKGLVEGRSADLRLRFPRYRVFLSNAAAGSLRLDLHVQLGE